MKPFSIPYFIIGSIITLCCNYTYAQGPDPDPVLQISKNPTTCNGSEGSITFSALIANATYQLTYTDDGVTKGPITIVADAAGQISIPNLNAGRYTHFIFNRSGSIKELFIAVPLLNPEFIPTFNTFPSICAGDPPPILPTTSNNGYSGTWNPAVVNNQQSGTYTFTPAAGTCANEVNITIQVTPPTEARFSFGKNLTYCGTTGPVPVLPNTSLNGITGTWSPAVVDPNHSGTYIFTPTSSGCIIGTSFTVTVDPTITPAFPFDLNASICEGDAVPALPGVSSNAITGTWSPASVSNTTSGTYTFTPHAGQCAERVIYRVKVNPIIKPVFSIALTSICAGETAPLLPATSDNGITGTWTPAIVSNTATGTYTFKPTSDPCAPPVTVTITVNPIITPKFSFGPSESVCINTTPPVLPGVSNNGIPGSWNPAIVDNQLTGTYTFTPDPGQCASSVTLFYEVNPIPSVVNTRKDTTVYDGAVVPPYDFTVNIPVTGLNWANTNPSIGLPASGSGTVPSFTATNMTDDPTGAVITATPRVNGCIGASQSYVITVLPLAKDIFVPNVFSPNNDGKNDLLFVYGNYIATFELHVFNQWGQRMVTLTDKHQGWDGKFKGSAQPVGVYVYVLKAITTDGHTVNRKGSITLVR
jgi:gliding motility-associated-like protein